MNKIILQNSFTNEYLFKETQYSLIYKVPNNKLYKLNKNYMNNYVNLSACEKMLDFLLSVSNKVNNVSFPTGMIYYDNRPVGYEMDNLSNFTSINLEHLNEKEFYEILYKIINIIEDFMNAGVLYYDINIENFLINQSSNELVLIDFDPLAINYQDINKEEIEKFLFFISMNLSIVHSLFFSDNIRLNFESFEEIKLYLSDKIAKISK